MSTISQPVAARVEELLREELRELGVTLTELQPHEIAAHMRCEVYPDESMVYMWKGEYLLRVVPEKNDAGEVLRWRMFTRNDMTETVQ